MSDADDLYEHRNDPSEWSDEAVEAVIRPSGYAWVRFQINSQEFQSVEKAARDAGITLSEYVCAALRAYRTPDVAIAVGYPSLGVTDYQRRTQWTECGTLLKSE